jgi:hypothetical protein
MGLQRRERVNGAVKLREGRLKQGLQLGARQAGGLPQGIAPRRQSGEIGFRRLQPSYL